MCRITGKGGLGGVFWQQLVGHMVHVRYILSLTAERVSVQECIYRYAPHNDFSVSDGGPIRL